MNRMSDFAKDAVSSLAARVKHRGDEPVPRLRHFDVQRYLGPWHVIAAIPLAPEIGAHNPVESYGRNSDGTITTTYRYRRDSFSGAVEVKHMTSEIIADTGGAEWKVKVVGPLGAQYVVAFVEDDYSAAIVARDARDHVWILARAPSMARQQLDGYEARIELMGYDRSKLVDFPQNGEVPGD